MRNSIIAFAFLLVACKHHEQAPPPPTATPTPAPPMVATSTGAPGSQDLAPLAHIGTKLSGESTNRPAVKVTAERLFAALADKGIELAAQHQVLAATAAASYCALGVTKDSIGIAVCEYPSAKAAEAGRTMMDQRYAKLVPDAVRTINGNTLVTVANGSSHRDVRDRIVETFKSL